MSESTWAVLGKVWVGMLALTVGLAVVGMVVKGSKQEQRRV